MFRLRKQKLDAKSWWALVGEYCDHFLEACAQLNTYSTQGDINTLLSTMETALLEIKATSFPEEVAQTRENLIRACSEMIDGFKASLSGDFCTADHFMGAANDHLKIFDAEIEKLIA